MCSFGLADAVHMTGRAQEARKLAALIHDVDLPAEECRPAGAGGPGRRLGDFPRAFGHSGPVDTALALPAGDRAG